MSRAIKGRGTADNPRSRFAREWREPLVEEMEDARPETEVWVERASRLLAANRSPDVPFARSANPYRGCEHGCIYCYARPTHNWLGLSSGLDFETKILVKENAEQLLCAEFGRRGYRVEPVALGTVTDPYQPIEGRLGLTRRLLACFLAHRHPLLITTKSARILRDLDLLRELAQHGLVRVQLSLTTLDRGLARRLEPRASAPHRRLEAIGALAAARVPVGVMVAPVIPGLTDHELETILVRAREAGAAFAGWVLLRLPWDLRELFLAWLDAHFPERKGRVVALLRACRGGRLNQHRFGERMRGEGPYARLLADRFEAAARRLGYRPPPPLRLDLFRPRGDELRQPDLFQHAAERWDLPDLAPRA